ncbi:HIT domain-containing protein [Winogradskyella sp.]|uniref:HIT domain-containing protein n=1 Tax=Winogradskyella sp. TaxID=1883156 RepID=UPI003BABCF14
MNCPFCNQDLTVRSYIETAHSIAFISKHRIHEGQSLVIPKKHVSSITDLSNTELSDLMFCIKTAIKRLIEKKIIINDYNLVLNHGEEAGQTVEHLHVHIIPRFRNDTIKSNNVLSQELFYKLIENSKLEMKNVANKLKSSRPIDDTANISTKATLIGDVFIGANTIIEDNVIIGQINYKKDKSYNKTKTQIGSNSIIRSGTVIYSNTNIGNNFDCGHNVVVRENCKIGNNTYVLSNTQINTNVLIGNNCRLYGFICNHSIIRDFVTSHGQLVHSYKNNMAGIKESAPIIESKTVIGNNAIIIGGITIGEKSYIGAGTVVTKSVKSNIRLIGNPPRKI